MIPVRCCDRVRLLVLLAALPGAARAFELGPETRDFDQEHLALDLALDLDRGEVLGTARLEFAPLADDFRVLRLHSRDTEVRGVTVGPRQGKFEHLKEPARRFRAAEGILEIEFARAYAKGTPLEVEISYLARPTAGLYFFRPTAEHPEIPLQVWSQGEGEDNRHWFPCYDLPDDRLSSEVAITVPEALDVYSNGVLVESVPGADAGTRKWRYEMGGSHVTYLISIVVGTFDTVEEKVGNVALSYHVPPGRAAEVERAFGNTDDMLRFFAEYTGADYPYPVYRQIVVWDFMYGGMENTTATTLNLRALHDERSHGDYLADYLVAHELAHQWFGDLVTCRTFDHIWLNEGFATYFTDLWTERHFGPVRFRAKLREGTLTWITESTPEKRASFEKKGDAIPVELPAFAYRKGAAVLHLLRRVLGDEKFQAGIRRYLAASRERSVETADFQRAMEEATGESLAWFFDPWVYGAGYPEFEVSWEWREAGRQAVVRVRQMHSLERHRGLFRVPVDLAFTRAISPPATEVRTVWLERNEHEFVFDLEARPDILRFDPGDWVPKKVKFERDVPQLALVLAHEPDFLGRIDAALALGEAGAVASDALASALAKESVEEVRQEIARALAKTGTEAAPRALAKLLAEDPASAVRRQAAEGLAEFRGSHVTDALYAAIEDDASDFVAGRAAESLGKAAGAEASDPLFALLERSSYSDVVRRGALAALARIGDEKALPRILEFARYRWGAGAQHELARLALEKAVEIGGADHPDVAKALVGALGDPYFRTRETAARLLADHGRLEAAGALLDAAKTERLRSVKETLESSIQRLCEVAAARDLDPASGRSEKELARMLETARARYDEAKRDLGRKEAWRDMLEAAAGAGARAPRDR